MAHKNSVKPQSTKTSFPIPVKRMLRRKEVEHKTGFSRATIYRLMRLGLFPQCSRIGIRAVAWDEQEIDTWMQERQDNH